MIKNLTDFLTFRKKSSISRAELAKDLGMSANYLYLIESEKKPFSPKFAQKVSDYLQKLEEKTTPNEARDEETAPYTVPARCTCPGCLAKDQQIAALNLQLNQAQAIALALAEAGRAQPPVGPVSGAGCGGSTSHRESNIG